ncbi:L,D-transpeptidase [Streptomyces sp. NPDC002577]
MARSSSGFVAGLTAAAIAVVGFLAVQAAANVPDTLGKAEPSASPTVSQSPTQSAEKKEPTTPPDESGTGERVVYSLEDHRVWLVEADGETKRTFEVTPSTVDPDVGTYTVTSRSSTVMGSDGVPIEHVVRFADVDGVVIGFSAAVNGSTAKPDQTKQTGGIRETREDGNAMWTFATVGTKVVVVP